MIAALGLVPGGMIDSLMPGSGLGRAAVILACNALIYSAIAFVGFIWWLRPDTRTTKRFTLFVGPVVLALVALACIPKISPLWPRGMRALGQQEDSLRSRLPEGTRIEYARTVLHDQGVQANEFELNVHEVVLENAETKILGEPGERVISARIDTEAGQFPCGYRIQVVLVFGTDGKLAQRYIERNAVCP